MNPDPLLGFTVEVSDIDKQLHRLSEADQASTTVSLINLVIASEQENSLRKNSTMIQELTQEHACRAILVEFSCPQDQPSLKCWINSHCHLAADGKKSVCSEQIAFEFKGLIEGRFQNTVFAHLHSDLPLIFWWQGEISSAMINRISTVVDRLILDSSDWEKPLDALAQIQSLILTKNPQLVFQDLSWARSYQLRLTIASFFDDEQVQAGLESIERIEMNYHPKQRCTALQVIAWFATQALWSLVHKQLDSFVFTNTSSGKSIEIQLNPCADASIISKVEFSAPDLLLRVTREKNSNLFKSEQITGQYSLINHSPADKEDVAELFTDLLSRGGQNTLQMKAEPLFKQLL